MKQLKLKKAYLNERLDKVLGAVYPDISRNKLQTLIKEGEVLVNGKKVKSGYLIKENDLLEVNIKEEVVIDYKIEAVNLNLEVIYEDEHLAVINKPKGLVVHPASSYQGITLVSGLLYQFDKLSTINGENRPGIIHRLDKDTSGLLIIAKSDLAHKRLVKKLANREITRKYYAITYGNFETTYGTINMPIRRDPKNRLKMAIVKEGRESLTHFKVLEQYPNHSLLELELITGRTHQLRVHLSAIKHPILGDELYGPRKVYGNSGQYLLAYYLKFVHPITKKDLEFKLELPETFKLAIKDLT